MTNLSEELARETARRRELEMQLAKALGFLDSHVGKRGGGRGGMSQAECRAMQERLEAALSGGMNNG